MMDSRTHARLDLALAAGLALSALLTRRARLPPAAAAVALTGLAAATDYEAGVRPLLRLPAHRALEAALGGAVLAVSRKRPLLAAAGLAQLALAAFGSDRPAQSPPDPAYHPLGTLKPFAENVWIVDDLLHGLVSVRMTVIRLQNGDLLLHSPTSHTPALQATLEQIGPIGHILAPNVVHWLSVKAWQDAAPGALTWAAPGLPGRDQVRRSGLRIDRVLGDVSPPAWSADIDQALVHGRFGFHETVMFHRPSRTAIVTDLLQNFEPAKLPWLLRPVAHLLGNVAPWAGTPAHLRAVLGRRDRAVARRIVGWAPERLLLSHGLPVTHGAAATLRRSLGWLTG